MKLYIKSTLLEKELKLLNQNLEQKINDGIEKYKEQEKQL